MWTNLHALSYGRVQFLDFESIVGKLILDYLRRLTIFRSFQHQFSASSFLFIFGRSCSNPQVICKAFWQVHPKFVWGQSFFQGGIQSFLKVWLYFLKVTFLVVWFSHLKWGYWCNLILGNLTQNSSWRCL
jgi:hypothetical protein